jgi:hypothetical protein
MNLTSEVMTSFGYVPSASFLFFQELSHLVSFQPSPTPPAISPTPSHHHLPTSYHERLPSWRYSRVASPLLQLFVSSLARSAPTNPSHASLTCSLAIRSEEALRIPRPRPERSWRSRLRSVLCSLVAAAAAGWSSQLTDRSLPFLCPPSSDRPCWLCHRPSV